MSKQIKSTTLALVCRRGFSGIVKCVLEREGFQDFRHGDLALIGGAEVTERVGRGASDAFLLTTDLGRAMHLVDRLAARPIRSLPADRFRLYTVGD